MPKLTAAQRAELEAQLAADDDDDDDEQVTISHGDRSFTGSMRKARQVGKAWGLKLEADPDPEPGDPPAKPGKVVPAARRFTGSK